MPNDLPRDVGTNLNRNPYKWNGRDLPIKNLQPTKFEPRLELQKGSNVISYIERVKNAVKLAKQTIVLPEAGDDRVIKAAKKIIMEDFADIILINPKENITGAICIDIASYEHTNLLAQKLHEYREHKGMTLQDAMTKITDPLYFATMLVKEGLADGMVAGSSSPTANVLRPALQILKTSKGVSLVSAFFIMIPNKGVSTLSPMIFADCGLNPNPNAEELAQIACSSAISCYNLLGEKAKIAMLSYSTKGSAVGELPDKVKEATRLAFMKNRKLKIDGELQLDSAIIPEIGEMKAPKSNVAGYANVLVFPDLNSGNIGYKIAERIGGATAYGPLLQGIAKPVNDLSRGCSSEDIVGVVAITALQAINME